MKPVFSDYLKAAFNARPFGLLVPPNWVGLGAFGLLGVLNPGYWLVGTGLELGLLLVLSHSPRFRKVVEGRMLLQAKAKTEQQVGDLLGRLDEKRRARYAALRGLCDQILKRQEADPSTQALQGEGLGRLLGIFLRLLLTQSTLEKLSAESDALELADRLVDVQRQLAAQGAGTELRRSLEGQAEILQKRRQALAEGAQKMAFTESELSRIEQQVALIRDEAGLSTSSGDVGAQIDRVSDDLGATSHWINDQQALFGGDDLAGENLGVTLTPPLKN